ncbi:MAG TPA: acyl-CoA thioesterase [Bacteroidia bacterium]|nr:acyl-CoA thioesterase [Bacteroidia bacterium]
MKVFETTHLIRFPDCDPFNHLNNSRYIDYFINAREDHLTTFHNFQIYKYAKETGKSWVVSQNQIAYLVPAMLMEKVIIQSTILEWNESDILVEMRMWDENKTRLKSLLWTKFVHIDLRESKRIIHEQQLTDSFAEHVNHLENSVSFEERLTDIRKKKYSEI